jgi:hypothetical protein
MKATQREEDITSNVRLIAVGVELSLSILSKQLKDASFEDSRRKSSLELSSAIDRAD